MESLERAQSYLRAAVPLLRHSAQATGNATKKKWLMAEAAHLEMWMSLEIPEPRDPFLGELTIYRYGQFVMGINAPFIDAALEAVHGAIGKAMFAQPPARFVAVDPSAPDPGTPPARGADPV